MSRILILSVVHRALPFVLQNTALALAHRAILSDTAHEFGLWVDFRTRPKVPGEDGCAHVCAVGDWALRAMRLLEWDYVLLVDADVVEYPADICSRLLSVNPSGITAPLPLIEGSGRLYDTFASVDVNGRRLAHDAPYWREPQTERFVDMQEVGMCVLVPGWVFAKAGMPTIPGHSGFAAACRLARESGLRVGIDRETVARHAELPKYGLDWH